MLVPKSGNYCVLSCSKISLHIINVTHLSDSMCMPWKQTLNTSNCSRLLIYQCFPMPRAEGGEFTVYKECQIDDLVLLPWVLQSLLASEITLSFATQIESSGAYSPRDIPRASISEDQRYCTTGPYRTVTT